MVSLSKPLLSGPPGASMVLPVISREGALRAGARWTPWRGRKEPSSGLGGGSGGGDGCNDEAFQAAVSGDLRLNSKRRAALAELG